MLVGILVVVTVVYTGNEDEKMLPWRDAKCGGEWEQCAKPGSDPNDPNKLMVFVPDR